MRIALVFEIDPERPTVRRLVATQVRDAGGVVLELPVRDPVARFDLMRDALAAADVAAQRPLIVMRGPRSICIACGAVDPDDAHECADVTVTRSER